MCRSGGMCDVVGAYGIRPATAARMCHRRWQTMHNRWWSDSATCGERKPHYHSASKMSNNVVPLRGTYLLWVHFPQAAPLWACQRLSMVKHLRRLLYFPVLRRPTCLTSPTGQTPTVCIRAYCYTPGGTNSLTTTPRPPCRLKGVTPKAKAEGT